MSKKLYLLQTKNKPNLYAVKEKKTCPFCGENYEKIKLERGLKEHETEKFLWAKNGYPVLEDLDMTLILLLNECNEGVPDYSVDRVQKLIDFTLECVEEMKREKGYDEVVIMQNYGYLSGGSVPHPHFQVNGIKNKEVKMNNPLDKYSEGDLIRESQDKKSRLTIATNPLAEKYELNISWEGNKMTEEAALYLKQATDFTRHYHPTSYKHYNLSFNYDKEKNINYIKVIYREPTSLYRFLGLHMTIKDTSDFIEAFNEKYNK